MIRPEDARNFQLAEASPAAMFVIQGGRIVYANGALGALTGYDRDELIGMEPRSLLHPSERAAYDARRAERESVAPAAEQFDVRILTRTGVDLWLGLTTVPFTYHGEPAMLGTGIDITDRKYLEDRMRRRLQLEAVGRLAGGVAHDFNNLLLVISGEAERLIEGLAEHDALRKSAEAVAQAAQRAASLTQHLLAFGRKQMLVARPLNVNDVVQELRGLWEGPDRKLSVSTSLADRLPAVRMDRARLEEIVISIVANAEEAMGDGGRVAIATDLFEVTDAMRARRRWLTGGTWVRVRISDTGPGVPSEVLARVFEPFFTTKRTGEGSGLGLSTVYGIVKQSGGFVWMDSTRGKGTCVTILLPPAADGPAAGATIAAPTLVRPHVLLVEDQDAVRDMLTAMLKRQGFEVSVAASAEDALAMTPERPVDLLLTDVVLPGMTGPDLARRLRASVPEMRVLFMSGYTGDALTSGDDLNDEHAFIQKPFASQLLLDRIRLLLNTPRKGFSTFTGQV